MKWTIEKFKKSHLNPGIGYAAAAIKIDPDTRTASIDWHCGAGFDKSLWMTGPDVTRRKVKDVKALMNSEYLEAWLLDRMG